MSQHATARRFTVDEYHRMAEAGILSEDDRVELIDGEVLDVEPIGSRHAASVDRIAAEFAGLGDRAIVRVQSPVRLGTYSEPEPDVALLRPDPDFYAGGHPGPRDVSLVVEVSESSLAYDRGRKLPIYARAGIPESWIVDLDGREVTVHRDPTREGYRDVRRRGPGDTVAPAAFPELELEVGEILA